MCNADSESSEETGRVCVDRDGWNEAEAEAEAEGGRGEAEAEGRQREGTKGKAHGMRCGHGPRLFVLSAHPWAPGP